MNARQMKKRLKRQIDELQSDNILMHEIIANSPKIQELRVKRTVPMYIPIYVPHMPGDVERTKQVAAMDLFEEIKKHITYEIHTELDSTSIMASIFIGKRR